MKTAAAILCLLVGAAQGKVNVEKLNFYPPDEELDSMDISFYGAEELNNLETQNALDLLKKQKINTVHSKKNANHLKHRVEVWEEKQKIVALMKEKSLEVEDDDEDIIGLVDEAEMDLKRIMKFDIDNFKAKQNQIELYEKETAKMAVDIDNEEEEDEKLGYLQSFAAKVDHYDEKMSDYMDGIRAEYKDVSFLQILICCNLVVFSIAATVGYLFYTPPGSQGHYAYKKIQDSAVINIPVDFSNMKVPKKEIKRQLKSMIKKEKNTKESML